MYTTHGVYIQGTTLGDNPPASPAQCDGVESCLDCQQEALAVGHLHYSREEQYNGVHTIVKIFNSLRAAGATPSMAWTAIAEMHNNGILFRERTNLCSRNRRHS